jgi:hypothetical protein
VLREKLNDYFVKNLSPFQKHMMYMSVAKWKGRGGFRGSFSK